MLLRANEVLYLAGKKTIYIIPRLLVYMLVPTLHKKFDIERDAMFNKILVVCIGNICRSPMGEALLKQRAEQHNLSLTVSSAGISAMSGWPADPIVQELLLEQGVDCSEHRARQLTLPLLLESDLVLVMEKNHRKEIERMHPSVCGKVHLLGKWNDFEIPDPYKKPKQFFQETYRLVTQGIDGWQAKLWK